jgi:hypothetical protein
MTFSTTPRAARTTKKNAHTLRWAGAALLALSGSSAFAIVPCSSVSSFDQLVQSGGCTTGPNGSVFFSSFATNVPASMQNQIGVATTDGGAFGGTGPVALLGFIFDTTKLRNMQAVSFAFTAQCDVTCAFNDASNVVGGNYGTGVIQANTAPAGSSTSGLQSSGTIATNQGFNPTFLPYASVVQEYAAFTQTAVPGLSESQYHMAVNIVPTHASNALGGISPNNCPAK